MHTVSNVYTLYYTDFFFKKRQYFHAFYASWLDFELNLALFQNTSAAFGFSA